MRMPVVAHACFPRSHRYRIGDVVLLVLRLFIADICLLLLVLAVQFSNFSFMHHFALVLVLPRFVLCLQGPEGGCSQADGTGGEDEVSLRRLHGVEKVSRRVRIWLCS